MKKAVKDKMGSNTILHVAEASGLSPATVSRVMNNHPYVKEETKKRVLDTIEKLGYHRNNVASGLRSNKTKTIGLIVPRISMFFHAAVITVVQNHLYKQGYNVMICQSNDSLQMEKDLVKTLHSTRVDAVIAACTLQTTDFSHFDLLMKSGIPVIFYDRVPMQKTSAILIKGDDVRGGYLAANHLIELGCKRIAHISGLLSCNLYLDRTAGFEKAMKQNNIPVNKDWIFHHELTYDNARRDLEKIFKKSKVPDGIVADNDTSAIAALEYAKEIGLNVPVDLKIIGYSNDPRSAIISPSITTIEQYPDLMGEKIVKVLMSILSRTNTEDVLQEPTVIPVQLIRRFSA
ncbi:PurR family transcriptional regulator [Arachidicoccus ginsenosidimutans]|uniref:LacI family DNA-binding transcriptional regulator n=1 Tax=Arachidicoccus sp. BS20 TaxID=1850526 RepID=UPI0007F0E786|nr:LacI family DNA-binding transcriptional regulator [Arachidicoccus sp. BS20]ANI89007.1 PurR family transcriptional regulator [Arachidicoccus sp. BS20]